MEVVIFCILVIVFSAAIYGYNRSMEGFTEYKALNILEYDDWACLCVRVVRCKYSMDAY